MTTASPRFFLPLLLFATLTTTHPLPAADTETPNTETPDTETLYHATPVGGEITAIEGPAVDAEGNLYFCSVTAKDGTTFDRNTRGSIGILRPGAETAEVWVELPEGMRFNGLRVTPWGTLLGADSIGKRIGEVDLKTGEVRVYFTFPEDSDRPNDVAIARDGTLYVSVPPAAVWQLKRNDQGEVEGRKIGEMFANGIELSPDETFLVVTTGIFQFGEDGMLERHPELRLRMPRAGEQYDFSDGMRFDQTGRLFVARAGGRIPREEGGGRRPSVIHIFGPDGTLERDVELPYGAVFNLAFGGPDGRTVYTVHGNQGLATFRTEHPGRAFQLFEP